MGDLNPEEVDKEILPFLSQEARVDVRAMAMEYFLGLTGTEEGRKFIGGNDKYLYAILSLVNDEQKAIAKDALLALVNLSTEDFISWKLLNLSQHPNLAVKLLEMVLKPDLIHADIVCMILSNLSRSEQCSHKIIALMNLTKDVIGFDHVIQVFCQENYNKAAKLHYLGPFLSNLTQIRQARGFILDHKKCVVQRLLPYTQYKESKIRRGGIVGTLRNCCFETAHHAWLLGDQVDILPRLLLPLAGPEEFDEEDMEKLPDDLQYLEPDKEREEDPGIRMMLIEAIHQLCTTKPCRDLIKDKNTYAILRELHKWETDPRATLAVENLVSLLISDEPEPDMSDLSHVEIPKDLEEKFQKADEALEKEIDEAIANPEVSKSS